MDTVKKYAKYLLCLVLLLSSIFTIYKVEAANDIILTFTDNSIEETVPGSGYIISGTSLEINKAGIYRIKGSCNDGNIEVKKGTRNVVLILDNLFLASSKTGPIVVKKDGTQVTIKSVGFSTIIDNENPENEYSSDPAIADAYEGAAIKVKSNSELSFEGTGVINAIGNANNGIKGGELSTITVNAGVVMINAVNNGLSCDHRININNGIVDITAENEGIKLEPNIDDFESIAKLTINGGRVDVLSGQDGIQAVGDIEINGWPLMYITSQEDAIQTDSNFTMTNGNLNIQTYEGHNPSTFDKDTMSAKGIKATAPDEMAENANNTITITGGTINIDSSDDALHSDGYMYITRGTINVSSGDDAIHADTVLAIGTVDGYERDPEINVNDAIEGIEAGNIYVYSGKVKVVSLDDGMNAAGGASGGSSKSHGEHFNPDTGQMEDNYALYIYGGSIYVNSEGDGLDANGSIYLYGGTHMIYHQDAQGNNSALDRDAKLVIDGATVFSAGGVADNGHVDSIGSSQEIIIDTTDYPANSKVAVSDGNVIFNDKIPKRSTYTFYSSPELTSGATIGTISEIIDVGNNPWTHEFDDGVITTPATAEHPGVITYTCAHNQNLTERKTYFYQNVIEFNIVNKTNGLASVRLGEYESTSSFNTTDVAEYMYITTNEDVELITTYDGINYDAISYTPTNDPNVYMYHINPADPQTFYIVLDGDSNMDGAINFDDAALISKSLLSQSNELYRELTNLEKVIADINDSGLINSHDGISIIDRDRNEDTIYTAEDFSITENTSIILDGETDGTVVVEFKANGNIDIDAIDGTFMPNIDNPSVNNFIQLVNIEAMQTSYNEVHDVNNGFAGMVDVNGISLSEGDVLYKATYKVDKNTPTGTYPITLKINSVTAHDSYKEKSFVLKSDVIVKGTTDPMTAFFSTDDGIKSIDVYYTQNYETPSEIGVTSTSVRNPDTGEIIADTGSGQVNFTVNLKSGYIISDISATPGKYKNIKGPADTEKGDTYRVTKITGDIEITITTKVATEYTATFSKDSHITSIDVYHTQDYDSPPEEMNVSETYARNSDTGEIDISGDGQINFRVNVEEGYRIDKVTVTGNYKNLKDQDGGIYRITKISGDIVVTVKSVKRTEIVPSVDGIATGYTYTGSTIKPEPSVSTTAKGTDPETGEVIDLVIPLVKGKDYKLSYGDNINVGLDAGSVTISALGTSQFLFEPITVNFDINKYTLNENNISAPASVVYTGSALTPNVVVSANGKTLVEGTDYDIAFANQDGVVGEYITATITGKGNFKGTVNNINVYITDKASQVIEFEEDEITKVYGENFTMTATLVEGDGTIRYTSNNTQAAVVDENTGAVTLIGTGQATIRAFASETDNYAETVTSYKLIVRKATLTITDATVNDKQYDENNIADVLEVTFDGLVNDDVLNFGTDYTVVGTFDDSDVGTDKRVTVSVDLSTEIIKKYTLSASSYETTASILPVGITNDSVELDETTFTYNGEPKEPGVTVTVNNEELIENVDYRVSYIDNVDAGEAYAVVVGIGNYATYRPIAKEFTINQKSITPTIEAIDDVTFDGTEKEPGVIVKDGNNFLEAGKDYTVTYSNNINAGTANAKINIVSTGNYDFDDTSLATIFEIKPYKLKDKNITVDPRFNNYDGTEKEPTVIVTYNGMTLIEDVDFEVSYSNNINVTEHAKATVSAISSNYTGTPSVYFEISDKQELIINATNNQSIAYTGEGVILGTVTVEANTDYIVADDLAINFYTLDDTEIGRPTDVGKYYAVYSYSGTNYKGSKKIEFEIVKADSDDPEELTMDIRENTGTLLGAISLTTEGLSFVDPTEAVITGLNMYEATYTQNNDTNNYNTKTVYIPVYGKAVIDVNTSVDGTGGSISSSVEDVIEGDTVSIVFMPLEGYEIDRVVVDDEDVPVENNRIDVIAGTDDMNVVVSYKTIVYNMNIFGQEVDMDEDGIIEVEHKSNRTIVIAPRPGYRLSSVRVNNTERISDVSDDNTITIENVTEDTDVSIKAEKISYEVIEGARQEYIINKHISGRFKINADYSLFENGGKVYVDDELVDPSNYVSKEGSTIITFTREYMDQLELGAHTLRVELNDGGDASCVFRVAVLKYIEREKEDVPKTYDNIITFIMLLTISIVGLTIIFLKKLQKEKMS